MKLKTCSERFQACYRVGQFLLLSSNRGYSRSPIDNSISRGDGSRKGWGELRHRMLAWKTQFVSKKNAASCIWGSFGFKLMRKLSKRMLCVNNKATCYPNCRSSLQSITNQSIANCRKPTLCYLPQRQLRAVIYLLQTVQTQPHHGCHA